jgi:outer membrane protein assembly factor BamB
MLRCVSLLALICVVSPLPADEPPDLWTRKAGVDWPAFLGPTGNSVSSETGLRTPWPKDGPRIVWQKRVLAGYAPVAVSRGRAFLFDRVENQARLRACNAETGAELWAFTYPTDYKDKYNYSNGPRCSPVVDGDRVYIFGPEGMLHCLKTETGKLVWSIDTTEKFGVVQNFFGVGSAPVIEDDLLIVQIGGSPKGSDDRNFLDLKGNGSAIVAFDKRTGQIKYQLGDELASYASPVLATIGGRRWCFLFARNGLVGFDPKTGKQDFHYPYRAFRILESVNASNPLVVGDRLLLSECYGPGAVFLKVKPGGVEEVWKDDPKARDKRLQCHWMTPIHVDGYVYGCSGRHEDAVLRCLELETGKVMWDEKDLGRTSLLLVDGHFICLSEDGTLRLLKVNPKKYELISEVELRPQDEQGRSDPLAKPLLGPYPDDPSWAAPVLSHGLLYLRSKNRVVCVEVIPEKK